MTIINDLPIELRASHGKLQSLVKPSVPYKRDTVGDSESALDGETAGGFAGAMILAALLPWWADVILDDSGTDGEEWRDYYAVTGLAAVGTTGYLLAQTDFGFWKSFGFGMGASVVSLFLMFLFHLVAHKCVVMFLYNRIFRASWVKKMRETDENLYRMELATYPERLAQYELDMTRAKEEATTALALYSASQPNGKSYLLEEKGFIQVSVKDELIKEFTEGAKGLFKKFVTR